MFRGDINVRRQCPGIHKGAPRPLLMVLFCLAVRFCDLSTSIVTCFCTIQGGIQILTNRILHRGSPSRIWGTSFVLHLRNRFEYLLLNCKIMTAFNIAVVTDGSFTRASTDF